MEAHVSDAERQARAEARVQHAMMLAELRRLDRAGVGARLAASHAALCASTSPLGLYAVAMAEARMLR